VMADRSDREQGQPNSCPRRHSLSNRMGPCSRTPSGPAVSTDCINRPDRRLHPTNATASIYLLQRGSHPQRTRGQTTGAAAMGPTADSRSCNKFHCYSITSSARPRSAIGTVRPSALAVFRLMTNSTLVACWTGRSAGFSPFRIRPT
jgi:hypothetical protein